MKEWSCKLLGKTRRGLALMMSVSFVLSVLAPVCFVQAAKQTKPLLNAKTKSLYYDKSGKKAFTLKVKKNKVRMIIATNWKTSKKSVVALSKKKDTSVKLTAKKKGNATVTGTIKYVPNGKWAVRTVRLTCKVTSKQAPIAEQVPTVPNQIPMPTVAPLQPGMSGTGATSMPNNPSEPTLAPTDKTTEASGETPYEPKETDLPPTLPTDQATEAPKETPYEPQETDLPTADQTATPTSPTDEATEAPEDSTDKPASNATQRPSRTFRPTKTTTPRPTSTGRPASSDFDVLSMAAVLPKADASVVNKVFSDVDTFSITNGKLVGTFDTINESVVLDLGREVDMNAYRGVEVKGVIPGQIALEFYDSGLDMTQTWDNGADKDWWETASGKTYPFYIGSCAWRYEDGAMNYLKAVQNGATKWSDTKVAPTEETQRFSLNKMAQYSTGDWSRIRYIVVTSNKSPSLSEQGRFDKENVTENRTPFTYRITGLKFLAEGVVDATDEGHYIIDTKMAAETSGNVKSYYADVVTEDKPANQRNTAMNFSDFKYICVQVKDTKKVKVGIMAEGETLADAVVVGEETGSGQRIVYFRVDTEENKELLKAVDAVSVQIDSGGTILKLSGTKGEIGFKDGVTKVDVVPDGDGLYRSTIVTSEKYGNNNYGTVIVPTASPKPTPNIIDLDEYTLDLKSQLWTNGFYDRTDNADGSITLKRQRGDLGWQVGEFGFAVPRDKVGDLHEFTEVIIRYRDSDLTDDLTKCGYVFHMGDDTEVGWIESEDGGHPNTLSFNGTGQTSIYAGETKSGESEANFSTIRVFDGKLGGKITIESVTLGKGKPGVETPGIETPGTETPGNETGGTEKPTPTHNPEGPVTYNVNQEYENTEADKAWFLYQLENPIKIKKTDNVKVVLSSADLGESTVALSDSTKEAPANVQQEAPLAKNVTEAGEITLDVTSYFTHNYADISKVVVAIPAGKKVKVEKIIVTPTDDVALSVHGLTTVEKDATSELTAEIADADFDSIEWTSSAPGTVSVAQDSQDPKKAVVTGVAAGEADVTIKVTKDGKTVKEEIVKITVTKKVSGNVYSLDISGLKGYDKATGKVTLKDNGQMIQFPKDGDDPLVVNPGQKVKFTFDYEIPEGGNNIRAYMTAGVDVGTTKEGSQDIPESKTITCTASGEKASTHLMIKGLGYGAPPNVILSGITMEFVE